STLLLPSAIEDSDDVLQFPDDPLAVRGERCRPSFAFGALGLCQESRYRSFGDGDDAGRRGDRNRSGRRGGSFLLALSGWRGRRLQAVVEAPFPDLRLQTLLRSRDRESRLVEKLADAGDDLDVALAVGTRADFFLPLRQNGEFRLPIAQNVRRDLRHLARFRGLVELLGHLPESYFNSRPLP